MVYTGPQQFMGQQLPPWMATPQNVTPSPDPAGLRNTLFGPVGPPTIPLRSMLSSWDTFGKGMRESFSRNARLGGPALGAGLITNLAAQQLPPALGLPASLLGNAGIQGWTMRRAGMPMSKVARTVGPGLALNAAGLGAQLLDPEDTGGLDVHDVGQGLSTAGIVGPLAIGLGASGPVGWTLAGLAGVGAASNWFGLGPKPNYYTEKELVKDLRSLGVDRGVAGDMAAQILEATAMQNDLDYEKIPQAARETLLGTAAQFAQQAGVLSPTDRLLAKAFGIDPTGMLAPDAQLTKDTLDLVNQYSEGYKKDLYPWLMQMGSWAEQVKNLPMTGIDPAYQELAKANNMIAALQISQMAEQLQYQAQTAPMQIAQDFAFGLRNGSFGGGSSSNSPNIDELLMMQQAGQQ